MSRKKPGRPKNTSSRNRKTHKVSDRSLSLPPTALQEMERLMRELVEDTPTADSALDEAQQLIYDAFETDNPREQTAFAHQALKVSPDCADAYVLLAELERSLPKALELFEQGVAAGERALGPEGFRECEGEFWGFLETRPYMRACEGLVNCLWAAERREEAVDHCYAMLRLNPNDNQGMRYRLASMLLTLERHRELEELLERYEDDSMADWVYTRALLAFRQEGDTDRSRQLLRAAHEVNEHVSAYLTAAVGLPREMPDYVSWGGEDEAVCYAAEFLPAWKATPGSITWLRSTLKVPITRRRDTPKRSWNRVKSDLAKLPHEETEVWQIDLRANNALIEDDGSSVTRWSLVIASNTDLGLVDFDVFEERPKDREIWDKLVAAMECPKMGEPHRPAEVHMTRRTWITRWQPRLDQIGITCLYDETLKQVDTILEMMESSGLRHDWLADRPALADADFPDETTLPQQAGDIWQADVRQTSSWVETDGQVDRPWMLIVVDTSNELILATDLTEVKPAGDSLLRGVRFAMHHPVIGKPHRPGIIQVADELQRELLAEHLAAADIQCVAVDRLEHLDRLIDDLAQHVMGASDHFPLSESPGVTTEQMHDFFAAAANFYRSRPWQLVPGDTILQIGVDRFDSGPWYAVVMGQSGMELGIALYEDLDVLTTMFTGQLSDEELGRRTSAISVTFGEKFHVAPQDVNAAEKHGWPVAGPEAYPCVMRVNPGMSLRAPLKWELDLLACALRAVPEFLRGKAASGEIEVSTANGTCAVHLTRCEDLQRY